MEKSNTKIKKVISVRSILVTYHDDKKSEYVVVDQYDTVLAIKPKVFDFKKYFGHMASVILDIALPFISEENWIVCITCFNVSFQLFFWHKSYNKELEKYNSHNLPTN